MAELVSDFLVADKCRPPRMRRFQEAKGYGIQGLL
jgi:hypothetical protein